MIQETFVRSSQSLVRTDFVGLFERAAKQQMSTSSRKRAGLKVEPTCILGQFLFRVRQEGAVVVVDARSASRLGKGDLGKNAARLRDYLGAVKKELGLSQSAHL